MKGIIDCMVLTASTKESSKEAGKFYSKAVIMQGDEVKEYGCANEIVEKLKPLLMKPSTKLVVDITDFQGKINVKVVGTSL